MNTTKQDALQKRVQILKQNLDQAYPTDADKERFKYSRDYVRLKGKYEVALEELERVGCPESNGAASAGRL